MPRALVSRSIFRIGSIFSGLKNEMLPWLRVYLVPKKRQLALRDVDAAQQRRIAGRAAQPQVCLGLQVLGQRALQLDIRRGLDLHVEAHAAQQALARRGRLHGLGGFRQDRAEVGLQIDAGAQDGDGAGEHAAVGGAGEIQVGIGHRADALRISHADLVALACRRNTVCAAAVAGEAGEIDLAAAGLAAEVLDGGAIVW